MKIQFLGAARQVTGSCYLLEAGGLRLLVDCGLFQERSYRDRNWNDFPVPPDEIDYLLLTHAHIDHAGLIPKFVRDGFSGTILATAATSDLLPIVLMDAAKLNEEDAVFKRSGMRRRAGGVPTRKSRFIPWRTPNRFFPSWKASPMGRGSP